MYYRLCDFGNYLNLRHSDMAESKITNTLTPQKLSISFTSGIGSSNIPASKSVVPLRILKGSASLMVLARTNMSGNWTFFALTDALDIATSENGTLTVVALIG